jgi:hypothetical protein
MLTLTLRQAFLPPNCAFNADSQNRAKNNVLPNNARISHYQNEAAVDSSRHQVLESYRQTLCRLSHAFLSYRPFRLSTLDWFRRAENFKTVWLEP